MKNSALQKALILILMAAAIAVAVYFGYINDFFDSIRIDSENLVRIATNPSTGEVYTGVFREKADGNTNKKVLLAEDFQ